MIINYPPSATSPVPFGKTIQVANDAFTGAGTKDYHFNSEAEAVLVSLFVPTISGTLDVSVYTLDGEGAEFLLSTFPQITAVTSSLVIEKGAQHLGQLSIRVSFSTDCSYRIYARGCNSAEASVRIAGATTARASQTTITTGAAQLLISAALVSRSGIAVMNNNAVGGDVLYVGYASGEATIANGWPIIPQGNFTADLEPGVELWATSSSVATDVRIMESGG